ncbi:MAG: DNA polymerase [Methanobacterium sp.]
MHDIAIIFDNALEAVPFALVSINDNVRVIRDFRKIKLPDDILTLGYGDAIDSFRKLDYQFKVSQKRLEVLFALTIGYSKGDQPKKWRFRKQEIIGKYLPSSFLPSLKKHENGEISWNEFSKELFQVKTELLTAVEKSYDELVLSYSNSCKYRMSWLETEFKIDNYFLAVQYNGVKVDKDKIATLLSDLNFQKYSALLYLEKNFNLDISSGYLSDEKIDELVLNDYQNEEKTEELTDLIQVENTCDKRIDAITTVKECRLDYANLIKHYSLNESQNIYPQYEIIGSSSGRIFVSSPGTQYLKKSKRDIFLSQDGYKLIYFDFRNYEPGIVAGLSNDKQFIEYYNSGDMYLKIATDVYKAPEKRKEVKITVLASLYGMSRKSLQKYFAKNDSFAPDGVLEVLETFGIFQSWKNDVLSKAYEDKIVVDKTYTRRFLSTKEWKIKTSALNHIIQSTGTRILKSCIIELLPLDDLKVLIPMHDALLCEIKYEKSDELKNKVVDKMESVFNDEIVNTTSRVVVSDFN